MIDCEALVKTAEELRRELGLGASVARAEWEAACGRPRASAEVRERGSGVGAGRYHWVLAIAAVDRPGFAHVGRNGQVGGGQGLLGAEGGDAVAARDAAAW